MSFLWAWARARQLRQTAAPTDLPAATDRARQSEDTVATWSFQIAPETKIDGLFDTPQIWRML
eukprot:4880134-Lingulodinium_polyedra.AAC.1